MLTKEIEPTASIQTISLLRFFARSPFHATMCRRYETWIVVTLVGEESTPGRQAREKHAHSWMRAYADWWKTGFGYLMYTAVTAAS